MTFVRALFLWTAAWAVGDVSPDQPDRNLETVKKEILQNWSKVESVSASVSVTGFLEQNAGGARTSGTGTYAAMRIGDQNRFRSELEMVTLSDKFDGGELRMESTELVIYDGTNVKILKSMSVLGQRNVMAFQRPLDNKPTMDLTPIVDADQVFNLLSRIKSMSMRLVEASPEDLPPVYVFELTFPEGVQTAKLTVYFDKKTGMVLRTRAEGRKVEWWNNVDYSDVKFNEKLDPNRFVFRLPKGVTFMDMTVPPKPDPEPGTSDGGTGP